jgi:hypothetical protein
MWRARCSPQQNSSAAPNMGIMRCARQAAGLVAKARSVRPKCRQQNKCSGSNWLAVHSCSTAAVESALCCQQEAEILAAWPWDRHSVGLVTVEHNYEAQKRRRIHEALLSRGMRFAYHVDVDDWFQNATLYQ